jgi:hypothetical protein
MNSFKKLVITGVVFISTTINCFALKAEYRFENCDGSATSKNHQGGGLNGTLKGDAKITLNGGQIQNGVTLSGDGMMSVSHSSKLDLIENLTISFWVNPKQKERQALIVKGGVGSDKSGANAEYSLVLWEDGKFKYKHNGQANLFSKSNIPLRKWTHIALVRDNGLKKVKIYINGKFDTEREYTIDPSSSGKERLIIGSGQFYSTTMHNFKGSLDEIKIYNIALSQTKIGEIYRKEKGKKHATGDCTSTNKCPRAIDDISNFANGSVEVDILSNDIVYEDKCNLDSSSVVIVSNPSGSTLGDNNKSLKVPNEGIWRVKGGGIVEFISEESFHDNPTDIKYRVSDSCGGVSNSAYIHLVRVAVSQPVECVTPTPTYTPTPTPITTPIPTHTPRVTSSPSPTPMPTHTPRVTSSPSPTPMPTHTPRVTSTPSSTPTPTSTGVADCECDDYKSTIPTLNKFGMATILILTSLLGAFFIREEKSI